MWRWRARILKSILPVAVALLLAYTADQILTGERGIVTWRMMHQQIDQLHLDIQKLQGDVARLDGQTLRLKPNADNRLDEDYLDEQIRRQLPLGKKGEEIILLPPALISATS